MAKAPNVLKIQGISGPVDFDVASLAVGNMLGRGRRRPFVERGDVLLGGRAGMLVCAGQALFQAPAMPR